LPGRHSDVVRPIIVPQDVHETLPTGVMSRPSATTDLILKPAAAGWSGSR